MSYGLALRAFLGAEGDIPRGHLQHLEHGGDPEPVRDGGEDADSGRVHKGCPGGRCHLLGRSLCVVRGQVPRLLARHGERSRSQLLLKLAGAEIMSILAVHVLAVNSLAVNGALRALYSVKKCLIHSI